MPQTGNRAQALHSLAQQIRLLVLDVDGVMTDGRIIYGQNGDELKAFHSQDGFGIKLVQFYNIEVAIITGRRSASVDRRANELGIQHLVQGREDKLVALRELLTTIGVELREVAYMGDDLSDLSAMLAVGLCCAPADAHPEITAIAHYTAQRGGGFGAVRELCDQLLLARNQYQQAISRYS